MATIAGLGTWTGEGIHQARWDNLKDLGDLGTPQGIVGGMNVISVSMVGKITGLGELEFRESFFVDSAFSVAQTVEGIDLRFDSGGSGFVADRVFLVREGGQFFKPEITVALPGGPVSVILVQSKSKRR